MTLSILYWGYLNETLGFKDAHNSASLCVLFNISLDNLTEGFSIEVFPFFAS